VTDSMEPMPTGIDQQQLAQNLVDAARTDGVGLIGPNGLLTGLTKTVLETALEVELSEHLGDGKHDPMAATVGILQWHPFENSGDRDRGGRDRGAA
jgi:hypothetical protein